MTWGGAPPDRERAVADAAREWLRSTFGHEEIADEDTGESLCGDCGLPWPCSYERLNLALLALDDPPEATESPQAAPVAVSEASSGQGEPGGARDDFPALVCPRPSDREIAEFPDDYDVQRWRQSEAAFDEIDRWRSGGLSDTQNPAGASLRTRIIEVLRSPAREYEEYAEGDVYEFFDTPEDLAGVLALALAAGGEP